MLTSQDPDPSNRPTFVLFRPFVAGWRWLFPHTQAHTDQQSGTARLIARIAVVVFCFVLVGGVGLYGRRIHDLWQTWRSNRLIAEAEQYEKSQKLMEAWRSATEAYHLDPDNPKAIRTLARYYVMTKQKDAGYLLGKLRRLGTFTDEDLILEISALSNASDHARASAEIEKILRDSKPNKKIVQIADKVMVELGRRTQLLEILKGYVEQMPDDHEVKYTYAIRRVEFGNAEQKAAGVEELWLLGANPDQSGLLALEFLDGLKLSTPEEQRRLVGLFEKHPLIEEEHRIAMLRRLVTLEPGRRNQIMDEAILQRRNFTREKLEPIARWLSLEGEYQRLFTLLNEDMVREYAPLMGHYLNALMLLKRHEDMERLIQDPRTQLMSHERAFYKAHLAYVTKKSWDDVDALLAEALRTSEQYGRPDVILRIAKYAEERTHLLIAEHAYKSASTTTPTRSEAIQRQAFDGLLKLTYKNGNSKGFMEACHDSAARWPDNQEIRERSIYATLLSGINLELAIGTAQKMLEERPTDSRRKLLMALGHYRMMNFDAAAQNLNHIKLEELSAGQGAVLSGILSVAGVKEWARKVSDQIPQGYPMLREESQFLLMANPARATPQPDKPVSVQ